VGSQTKTIIGVITGCLPIVATLIFGIILTKQSTNQNAASWAMWSVLNAVIAFGMFGKGNKDAWLPTGYTVGTLFVALILIGKGSWHFGFVETTCAVGATIAMIFWLFSSPNGATVIGCVAMWIASVPILRDTWIHPDPTFWWLWCTGAVAALSAILLAPRWSIEHRLFPTSSFIFNAWMTAFLLFYK
jgi:hypothetical protein